MKDKIEHNRLPQNTMKTGQLVNTRLVAEQSSTVPSSKKRMFWRWFKRITFVCIALSIVGSAALVGLVLRFESELPSIAELKRGYRPPQVTRIVAKDGSLLSELFTERRTVVKIADLPAHVKLAVLAAEDATFYEHHGINYLGILRAIWVNLRHQKTKQGASTITQQVVKNLLLDSRRTYQRKIRELLLARRIEQELTKDEILELYLNHIYFGSGRYGIEEAARGYFGKHARELSIAEAALLAGLPASPHLYSPRTDMNAALRRRNVVLKQLQQKSFVSNEEYETSMSESIKLAPVVEANEEVAPEVVDWVRRTIRIVVGEEAARRGGFTVETSIDPKLQIAARKAVRDTIAAYDKRWKLIGPFTPPTMTDSKNPKAKKKPAHPNETPFSGEPRFGHGEVYVGVVTGHNDATRAIHFNVGSIRGISYLTEHDRYNPNHLKPSVWAPVGTRLHVSLLAPIHSTLSTSEPSTPTSNADASVVAAANDTNVPLRIELGPEAALVAIDMHSRQIVALIGNVEAAVGGRDRATFAKRQPGSTFKPFVYGAALASRKFTPASLIEATPTHFGTYNPKNYEVLSAQEPIRLREALAQSVNLVAVRVTQDIGPQSVINFARLMGIQSKLEPDLSLSLGAYEVTPLELATAYSTLAAGGIHEEPRLITRILGPDGKEIPLPHRKPAVRVLGEAEAYVLTDMMTSVIQRGTGGSARALGRPVAGKTGTSNRARDAWFAGFSTDITAAVWIGFDDSRALGWGESGARTAVPAWVSFMKAAHEKRVPVDFPKPAGVVRIKIDPKTGKLPYTDQKDSIDEVFLVGTEPIDVADVPEDKKLDAIKPEAPEDPWVSPAGSVSVAPPTIASQN